MKILATSAYDTHEMLDALLSMAAIDRLGNHTLCGSAEEADLILFVENTHFDDYLYKQVRLHPLTQQYPEKTFMYNESDKPWSALPGLYCSMPRRFFQNNKQVAFPYLSTPNEFIKDVHTWDLEKRWLFSFVGSVSHRIGTSSFRLFETLEAGCAPVIIANQWVPTPHINWDFAVRVDERDIKSIPALLRSISDESADRGKAARAAWESAYAPDVMFDTVGESLGWLLEERRHMEAHHPWRKIRKVTIAADLATTNFARSVRRHWQQVFF